VELFHNEKITNGFSKASDNITINVEVYVKTPDFDLWSSPVGFMWGKLTPLSKPRLSNSLRIAAQVIV
jgi:hypothetical protein